MAVQAFGMFACTVRTMNTMSRAAMTMSASPMTISTGHSCDHFDRDIRSCSRHHALLLDPERGRSAARRCVTSPADHPALLVRARVRLAGVAPGVVARAS